VLVVEDESILALDIQGYLQSLGYKVAAVTDKGEIAVKLAKKHQPDLVLMDIRLKGEMDGIDAGEQIWQTLRIPIIYLTAYAEKATLERAKKTMPYAYILKPFDSRDIQTAVEIALSKHAEEMQVREKRDWLNKVLMSLGDAVITADLNAEITYLNPKAEEVTGWNPPAGSPKVCRSHTLPPRSTKSRPILCATSVPTQPNRAEQGNTEQKNNLT
ncbi:MAG: response regulator, partial [Planctomycetes bacterium]|nr:response regulator [Planctomycetota bacterium]